MWQWLNDRGINGVMIIIETANIRMCPIIAPTKPANLQSALWSVVAPVVAVFILSRSMALRPSSAAAGSAVVAAASPPVCGDE